MMQRRWVLTPSSAEASITSVDSLIEAVRPRIWTFLSGASGFVDLAPVAEDLLRLPRGDLRRLGALHVALSREARDMLDASERLLRELPSSAVRNRIESRAPVRMPVLWRETWSRRLQSGDQSIFVSAPSERRYDTPLARLVKRSLRSLDHAIEIAGIPHGRGEVARILSQRGAVARRLLQHAKLRDVRDVATLPAHAFRGALRHRNAAEVAAFARLHREVVEIQAPRAVKEVVARQLLVPSDADRVFELYVGFELIEALRKLGYVDDRLRLLPNRSLPFGRLRRPEGDRVTVWYQRSLTMLADSDSHGEYARALKFASLSASSLRPDFMLVHEQTQRALIVEVKYSERERDSPDRVGIKDALMYLQDGRSFLPTGFTPRALVVAWNSRAIPSPEAEIAVCSQFELREVAAEIAKQWLDEATINA